ncbi:hypothetical protein D3C87_1924690 [compost metagenome]
MLKLNHTRKRLQFIIDKSQLLFYSPANPGADVCGNEVIHGDAFDEQPGEDNHIRAEIMIVFYNIT